MRTPSRVGFYILTGWKTNGSVSFLAVDLLALAVSLHVGVQQLRVGPENVDFVFDGGEVLVACHEGGFALDRAGCKSSYDVAYFLRFAGYPWPQIVGHHRALAESDLKTAHIRGFADKAFSF